MVLPSQLLVNFLAEKFVGEILIQTLELFHLEKRKIQKQGKTQKGQLQSEL